MKRYVFYNPNPKQRYHKDGTPMRWLQCDCTVRALCKVENSNWETIYKLLAKIGLKHYMMPNDPDLLKIAFTELGYVRHTFKNTERIPLNTFATKFKSGSFLAMMTGHIVAVVDGKYYDVFDVGNSYITSYWEKPVEE